MKPIRKIMFPVDLSEASPKVAPMARLMAEQFGAELHVVFAARAMDHYVGVYVPYPQVADFESKIFQGAEKKLNEFIRENLGGLTIVARVVAGYPAEEILRYADEEKIDLIIMGTHGRKGLERIVFGSVADYVVKKARMPVLTVNPYRQARPAA